MKYKEPQILLEVRKIKEQIYEQMLAEGLDAFYARINRHATKWNAAKSAKVKSRVKPIGSVPPKNSKTG